MFVVLDDDQTVVSLVISNDLLSHVPPPRDDHTPYSKEQLHYLLRSKRVCDLAPTVLETLACIDGAIVLDREAHLLAFGAILRYPLGVDERLHVMEGGRTTAALTASRFGNVLKISEDGLISFFQDGECIWEM